LHHGLGPLWPADLTLAFGICAGALIVGVVTSLLIPRVQNMVSPMRVVSQPAPLGPRDDRRGT
jgi:hypothetical protein